MAVAFPKGAADLVASMLRDLECAFCGRALREAVTLPCLHHLCRACADVQEESRCPVEACHVPFQPKDVAPNLKLRSILDNLTELRPLIREEDADGGDEEAGPPHTAGSQGTATTAGSSPPRPTPPPRTSPAAARKRTRAQLTPPPPAAKRPRSPPRAAVLDTQDIQELRDDVAARSLNIRRVVSSVRARLGGGSRAPASTPASPPRLSSCRAVVVTGTALPRATMDLLQRACRELGGRLVRRFAAEVTHVVSAANADGLGKRTLKYMMGVSAGRWVVSPAWVERSVRLGAWAGEAPHELAGDQSVGRTGAPGRNRRAHEDTDGRRLFEGLSVAFHGSFAPPDPSSGDLQRIVTLGGGKVLTTVSAALRGRGHRGRAPPMVVCPAAPGAVPPLPREPAPGVRVVTLVWVLDSVSHGRQVADADAYWPAGLPRGRRNS